MIFRYLPLFWPERDHVCLPPSMQANLIASRIYRIPMWWVFARDDFFFLSPLLFLALLTLIKLVNIRLFSKNGLSDSNEILSADSKHDLMFFVSVGFSPRKSSFHREKCIFRKICARWRKIRSLLDIAAKSHKEPCPMKFHFCSWHQSFLDSELSSANIPPYEAP